MAVSMEILLYTPSASLPRPLADSLRSRRKKVVRGGASEAEEVDELKGGGERPVDVTGVEELTAVEGPHVVTMAGGHGEVGKGGNEGHANSDEVVEALGGGRGGLVHEVGGGDGEAKEGDEEHLVALLGEVRLALIADDGLVVAARGSGDEGEEADEDKGGGLHGAGD